MRFGLCKIFEHPLYTELADFAGSGFVGRVMKGGAAAGLQVCVTPGVGPIATMLSRIDLLAWPGAEWVTTDAQYSRVKWQVTAAGTWRPVNGSALLMSAVSKFSSPLQTITGTGTYSAQPVLVANLLQPGMQLRIRAQFRKKGTAGTSAIAMYIGTAGTTGDGAVFGLTVAASTNRDVWAEARCMVIDSGTLAVTSATPVNVDGGQFGGTVTTNINTAAAMKLTVGVTATSPDTLDLLNYALYIEAP